MTTSSTNMDSDSYQANFPFWEHLHGLWRTLPNFNLHPLSLDPGQGIGKQMESLMNTGKANVDLVSGGEVESHEPHLGTPAIFEDTLEVHVYILIVSMFLISAHSGCWVRCHHDWSISSSITTRFSSDLSLLGNCLLLHKFRHHKGQKVSY